MVFAAYRRMPPCALGLALVLLGMSSSSFAAEHEAGAGVASFTQQGPPLATLDAMIQADLTDVPTEILPDSVPLSPYTSPSPADGQSQHTLVAVAADADSPRPAGDGHDYDLLRPDASSANNTYTVWSQSPGEEGAGPSIKSLAIVDFDSEHPAERYGPSPTSPIQLLKPRGPVVHEFAYADSLHGSPIVAGSPGGSTTVDWNAPLMLRSSKPVVYDPRAIMVADRNYIKQIGAQDRQSKEYNKLVKKATRASVSPNRKRYGIGVYADSPGTAWWMKDEQQEGFRDAVPEDAEGAVGHPTSLDNPSLVNAVEERRLQPRLRIFSQSVTGPKKTREGDRRDGGTVHAWKTREDPEREPPACPPCRTKQLKDERIKNSSHDERPDTREVGRRAKDTQRHTRAEMPLPPKYHQSPRDRPSHAYPSVHAEALDEDDFEEYDELDDDFEGYEEHRPQRHYQDAISARSRNAQAYGIYLPDIYERPPAATTSSAESWGTVQTSSTEWTNSSAFTMLGVPISKTDIDYAHFFADDSPSASADTAKGITKKPFFSRKKQQAEADEEVVVSPQPSLHSDADKRSSAQETKKVPLLARLKPQHESADNDEKQKFDVADLLTASGWRPSDHAAKTKTDSSEKKRNSEKRSPLRERKAKVQESAAT
ncbi:hypothetical protein BESB_001940 [Besnoitia besnoiti]|uniref:Transmembrane protein n=1 Tax=Besnoitia besnoiti TaxID=94643 RepID=A0A2A9MPS5_BESBE|nr:hypothetical protein BESB_001940 [Besnoitia besnoiti]PFH37852.1 hypothetical protein BESB_001940 [Besnoitia besnoiti]